MDHWGFTKMPNGKLWFDSLRCQCLCYRFYHQFNQLGPIGGIRRGHISMLAWLWTFDSPKIICYGSPLQWSSSPICNEKSPGPVFIKIPTTQQRTTQRPTTASNVDVIEKFKFVILCQSGDWAEYICYEGILFWKYFENPAFKRITCRRNGRWTQLPSSIEGTAPATNPQTTTPTTTTTTRIIPTGNVTYPLVPNFWNAAAARFSSGFDLAKRTSFFYFCVFSFNYYFLIGEIGAEYDCYTGKVFLNANYRRITCQNNGQWSTRPECLDPNSVPTTRPTTPSTTTKAALVQIMFCSINRKKQHTFGKTIAKDTYVVKWRLWIDQCRQRKRVLCKLTRQYSHLILPPMMPKCPWRQSCIFFLLVDILPLGPGSTTWTCGWLVTWSFFFFTSTTFEEKIKKKMQCLILNNVQELTRWHNQEFNIHKNVKCHNKILCLNRIFLLLLFSLTYKPYKPSTIAQSSNGRSTA